MSRLALSGQRVEGREALLAAAGAAAPVGDAVGAGAVPRHADEEPAVVAEVRRPPILRIGHHGLEVLDDRIQVEAIEFLGVIELLAHRVGQGRLPVEDMDIELIRPPVPVRTRAAAAANRAFAFVFHGLSSCNSADNFGWATH